METLELYGCAGAAMLTAVTLLWIASVAIRDASIIDAFCGPLFVAIAWVLLAVNLRTAGFNHLLVVFLVTAWGLRLLFTWRQLRQRRGRPLPVVARPWRRPLVVEDLLNDAGVPEYLQRSH